MSHERDLSFDGVGIDSFDGTLNRTDSPKINILLVDDNEHCLMALKEVLAGPDRHLVMVQSGEEALRYLLAADVGIVLLDIRLSGLSGYETAALIRQRNQTRSVPIIFVTGCSKEHADVVRGYSFGAVDYIFKPIDPEMLKSKVDCFVELAKSTQRLKQQTRALALSEKEVLRSRAAGMVVNSASVPMFITGLDGVVVQANSAAHDLIGLHVNEAVGSAGSCVLTPGEKWVLCGAIREAAERGAAREVPVHPRSSGEGLTALIVHVTPLRNDEGRVIGVIGLGQDLARYEQAMMDLERTRVQLQGTAEEVEHLKEIVVARDLALLRLKKERDTIKDPLLRVTPSAGSPHTELRTNEADQ